jgi:ParB family transcriptional regulator, chromosome partitioning protein
MNRGMGRGLAAILPQPGEVGEPRLREIPLGMIRPSADQPRRRFDEEKIKALALSIAEEGLIQPVIVRPLPDGRYELIAGERRWRAAREAQLETIPALVRDEEGLRQLQIALIENVAREDLNPVEEARACATLVDELGVSKEELARRLGRSRPALSNLIRILDLPDEALALMESGDLSEGHGRAILQASGTDVRRGLAREAARAGWSVRETERRAKGGAAKRRPRVVPHPDQEEMLARAEETLESALGHGVKVKAAGKGIRAELHFDDLAELEAFAKRAQA